MLEPILKKLILLRFERYKGPVYESTFNCDGCKRWLYNYNEGGYWYVSTGASFHDSSPELRTAVDPRFAGNHPWEVHANVLFGSLGRGSRWKVHSQLRFMEGT